MTSESGEGRGLALELILPSGFDAIAWEVEAKGWFSGAKVRAPDRLVDVTFCDTVRLQQEVQADLEAGGWCALGAVVVVPSVTAEHMAAAVDQLRLHRDEFNRLSSRTENFQHGGEPPSSNAELQAFRDEAYLSLPRAMWDIVTPTLRAVALRVEYPEIRIRMMYERVGSEEHEFASLVETYVIADFPPPVEVTSVAVEVPRTEERTLEADEQWFYRRNEDPPESRLRRGWIASLILGSRSSGRRSQS